MKTFSSKQAFLFALINYVGVLIGVFSTLFIYPQQLEFLGIIRFIDGWGQILYPVLTLGASTALLNFQPTLSEYNQRVFFGYVIKRVLLRVFVVLCAFVPLIWIDGIEQKAYYFVAFCLAACLAFVDVFKKQAVCFQKLSYPTFVEKIVPKLVLPLIFVGVVFYAMNWSMALFLYVLAYVVVVGLVGVYVFRLLFPKLGVSSASVFEGFSKGAYRRYALYAFTASLGSFFAFRIDSVMIPYFLDNYSNGIYNIGVNVANMLMIPAVGYFALYSPIISSEVKNENYGAVEKNYQSTANTLYFIGSLVFGGIVLGVYDVFGLLPAADKLLHSVPIIIVLGMSVLFNMSMSFNTEIISFSRYYKYNLYGIVLLAFVNLGLNVVLLTQTGLGILGVGIASLVSMVLFNLFLFLVIRRKMNIVPHNGTFYKIVVYSLIVFVGVYFLPNWFGVYGFVVKILLFASLYIVLTWRFVGVYLYRKWLLKK